ncbi:hypothetical protein [Aeromonas allosaccharophila]|uniref:hypothetical protein n=1 Tax=Aeromonas allosaccharophila TaxID=656 RepID=UPI00111A0826|nr:hypothetical protein [Aeromonas allosaccharophila]
MAKSSIIECANKCFTALKAQSGANLNDGLRFSSSFDGSFGDSVARLKKLTIKNSSLLSFDVGIVWLEDHHNNEKYILIFDGGFFNKKVLVDELQNYGLEESYKYPSLFMRALSDSNINILIKHGLDIKDIETDLNESEQDINPFEFIDSYFEDFISLKVVTDDSNAWLLSPNEFFCLLIAIDRNTQHLDHSDSFINGCISFIFNNSGSYLPYDTLEMSLASQFWKHSFIEAYRSIESLYYLPRAMLIKDELETVFIDDSSPVKKGRVTSIKVASLLNRHISRKSEQVLLNDLLLMVTKDDALLGSITENSKLITDFIEKTTWSSYTLSEKIKKVAEVIYLVRCQNVHLEYKREPYYKMDETKYRNLVTLLWNFSFMMYQSFHDELVE